MAVGKGKKRYNITMRPEIVTRFQSLAKSLGMPPSVMSAACEDALKTISEVFQRAKDKGSLDLSDIHHLIGQQMDLLQEEEKRHEESPQKTKGVDKAHRG